jgi:hypothetical protein
LISEKNKTIFNRKIQDGAVLLLLEVERHAIVLFHAVMEGYDGMATVKTIDEAQGVIAIITTQDCEDLVLKFLENVREELPWRAFEGDVSTEELFEYREV